MLDFLTTEHIYAYDDAIRASDGRLYKVIGDLHPSFGVMVLLEYVAVPNGRKHGYEKTFDYCVPDLGLCVEPSFPQWFVPLYNRVFEIVPHGEIVEHFKPEDVVRQVAGRDTPEAAIVDDLLTAFSQAAGIDKHYLGVNGSWMVNLAIDTSNVNLDVFGAEPSLRALDFVISLAQNGGQGDFFPPDPGRGRNQAALRGLCRDAFKGVDEATAFATLGREGRLRFSGFYKQIPFTVEFHGWHRGAGTQRINQQGWRFRHRTIVEATVADTTGLLRFHSPCTIGLTSVRDTLLKTTLPVSEVTSWSKRFWFTQPGDQIRFLADVIDTPAGQRLAVSGFGDQWIFEFMSRNTAFQSVTLTAAPTIAPPTPAATGERILVLTNRTPIATCIFEEARRQGHEMVTLLQQSPKQQPRLVPGAVYAPDVDVESITQLARRWDITSAIYASTTYRHETLRASAQLAAALQDLNIRVIAHPAEVIDTAIDKARTKALLQAHGVPVPRGMTACGRQQVIAAAETIGFPLILKHVSRSGGFGIAALQSQDELQHALADGGSFLEHEEYLVEEFIEGVEFSVEVLVDQGQALPLAAIYKDRIAINLEHPMGRPRIAPWRGPEAELVRDVAARAARAIGGCGVLEFDIAYGADGPMVLEANPRLGGVTFLGLALGGLNSPLGLLKLALGTLDLSADPGAWHKIAAELPFIADLDATQVEQLREHRAVYHVVHRVVGRSKGIITLVAHTPTDLLQVIDDLRERGLEFVDLDHCLAQIRALA